MWAVVLAAEYKSKRRRRAETCDSHAFLGVRCNNLEGARPFRSSGSVGATLLSAALKLPCMLARSNVHRAVVDQCMFGLCDPSSRRPYRKRTALDVNSGDEACSVHPRFDPTRGHRGQNLVQWPMDQPLSCSGHLDQAVWEAHPGVRWCGASSSGVLAAAARRGLGFCLQL